MKMLKYASISLLALASCAGGADEPQIDDTGFDGQEAAIVIAGGAPGVNLSRAGEPYIPGVCEADEVNVQLYYGGNGCTALKDLSLLAISNPTKPLNLTRRNEQGGTDRLAQYHISYTERASVYNHYYVTALAYSTADWAASVTDNATAHPTDRAIQLKGTHTPEFYFGAVTYDFPSGYGSSKEKLDNGIVLYYTVGSHTYSPNLKGEIYRIVSQVNLSVTDFPTEHVDHVDLVCSRQPRKIILSPDNPNSSTFSRHGRFYPVTATKSEADCNADAVIATTSAIGKDGKLDLSAFLLPSEVGYELYLNVYFNISGQTMVKKMNIQPTANYYLSASSTSIYDVPEAQKAEGRLLAYRALDYKFYSYSNVRVNITGRYVESSVVDAVVQVESSYEADHTITIH